MVCFVQKRKEKEKLKEKKKKKGLIYTKKKTMRKEQEKAAREVKSIYC